MWKIITDPCSDRFALMKTAADMGMFSDRLYVDFLFSDRGKEAFRSFFKCLLDLPGDRAVLWHCTDGKDRTGVASMLVLTVLGADKETILEDYMLTNEYNRQRPISLWSLVSGHPSVKNCAKNTSVQVNKKKTIKIRKNGYTIKKIVSAKAAKKSDSKTKTESKPETRTDQYTGKCG